MKDALEKKIGALMNSETENSVLKKYHGFDIAIESMEELFIIDYKHYTTNELESYSRVLDKPQEEN
jgi:hypothetical protein